MPFTWATFHTTYEWTYISAPRNLQQLLKFHVPSNVKKLNYPDRAYMYVSCYVVKILFENATTNLSLFSPNISKSWQHHVSNNKSNSDRQPNQVAHSVLYEVWRPSATKVIQMIVTWTDSWNEKPTTTKPSDA